MKRSLAAATLNLSEVERGGRTLQIETGALTVYVGLAPYGLAIYRDGQLISADTYGKNICFSNQAMACLRNAPISEHYYGFGEKAGDQLDKKYFSMTCFNYDNFTYQGDSSDGIIPQNNQPGPLNPSEPLYNSMPFMLAVGTSGGGAGAGTYAYGLFLDNVAQSFFNMGSNDYSDMSGKYYFGALYGDLDYYLLIGDGAGVGAIRSVLNQYSQLTGRAAMPPKYALGYHQGCYGYYNAGILLGVAPPFLYDTRANQGESSDLFLANEGYGDDDTAVYPNGKNPYTYPTPLFPDGQEALGTYGFYSDNASIATTYVKIIDDAADLTLTVAW